VTLRDAANYILKLPKAERAAPQWQAAAEARTCLPRSYSPSHASDIMDRVQAVVCLAESREWTP
jgi:hypothetical protein